MPRSEADELVSFHLRGPRNYLLVESSSITPENKWFLLRDMVE